MLKSFFPFHSKETSSAIKKTFYTQNVIITMFSYCDRLSYSKSVLLLVNPSVALVTIL